VKEVVEQFAKKSAHEAQELPELERKARESQAETAREEGRAMRLDIGEGFLELGLVLSSLYFLSKRRFFPALGISAAVIGTVLGVLGFMA